MTAHPIFIKLAAFFGWVPYCSIDGGEACYWRSCFGRNKCAKWKFAPDVTG